MSMLSNRLGFALVLAALCLGGRTAHAQVAPVPYWMPSWPIGFGGIPAVGESSNTYGNFPGFDGSDAGAGGASHMRHNFPNGWFVGAEGGGIGLNGINQVGAFGNFRSLNYQGVQFGYNFQNAPLTVYAGFDTMKYTAGNGGPFAAFDTTSGTLPGYSAHVGAEFRPVPNLSLSLGFGYTQSGPIDSDVNSSLLPGASPFAAGVRR
jgi:opacity protein-like surface antigen